MEKRVENVFSHENYRAILREDFFLRSERNQRYSLRSYANDLELSPAQLSMVLQNKRHLSKEKLGLAASKLGFDDEETSFLLALHEKEKSPKESISVEAESTYRKHRPYNKLNPASDNQVKTLCKSLKHLLVFNCFDFPSLRKAPEKIHALLQLEKEDVREIIDQLVQAELLEKKEDGLYYGLNQMLVGNDSTEELLQHVLELKALSASLVKQHEKVVDKEKSVSIFYHAMINKKDRVLIIDAMKRFQHEVMKVIESSETPDSYFLVGMDMQRLWKLND